MKNTMKMTVLSVIMACGLAFSSVAQDTQKESLFNAKELSLNLGTSVQATSENQVSTTVGLSYSLTKNIRETNYKLKNVLQKLKILKWNKYDKSKIHNICR